MMKKLLLLSGLLLIILVIWSGLYYWRNLRGSQPAFAPPPRDITEEPIAVNSSGFPLQLPRGFSISIFAKNLAGPRVIIWDPVGRLLVSLPSQGKVMALRDTNGDGVADEEIFLLEGLNQPHGLAWREEKLYVAETDQVATYDYDKQTGKAANKRKLFDLPGRGNHFTRTIGFGPDGRLYISVGSSCNVCVEKDWRRAKILVADADGKNLREYASGLRNSVFFVWNRVDASMWATDMGRDLLGDNTPPEEVNIIKDGGFYGWPLCYGNRVHDRSFNSSAEAKQKCEGSTAPQITFQAHSAPLGLAFIPDSWPQQYRGDLLVSYHGSWNRSEPTGYKVVRFDLDRQLNSTGESDFIWGWLNGQGALGRPVDLLFDQKGNLYLSDDKAGVIYRVTYQSGN